MDIKEIASKIARGEASEEEARYYLQYMDKLMDQQTSVEPPLPADQALLDKIHLLIEQNEQQVSPAKRWLMPVRIAATILLITSVSLVLFYNKGRDSNSIARKQPEQAEQLISYAPGKDQAVLILADGRRMLLESIPNGTSTFGSSNVSKSDSSLAFLPVGNVSASSQMNTLYTPKGGQYKLTMADGTTVWLNASSSIKFPAQFDKDNRTVSLTGEAYFEVSKNPHQPFLVKLPDGNTVEVLGTHFNIKAYPNQKSQTSLMEGKIAFRHKDQYYALQPGQEVYADSTNAKAIVVSKFDKDERLAWRNGFFHFSNTPVDEVLEELSRWYNVDIEYKGTVADKHFDGVISRNINSDQLIRMLSYSGLKITTRKDKIIVE